METLQNKLRESFKSSTPFDNIVFATFAKNKKFCEEMVRVLLEDPTLEIVDAHQEDYLANLNYKSCRLDLLCKLKDGTLVNVEIQKYEEKEHAKRIFYYASSININHVEKGTDYKDIKDIIIIYLSLEDIFKQGSTVYNVEMSIKSENDKYIEPWKPGLIVKYINTKGKTNIKISDYLKLMTDDKSLSKEYPEISKLKEEVYEKGGMTMTLTELVEQEVEQGRQEGREEGRQEGREEGRQEGRQEGKQEGIMFLYMQGNIDKNVASQALKISVPEFEELLSKYNKQ